MMRRIALVALMAHSVAAKGNDAAGARRYAEKQRLKYNDAIPGLNKYIAAGACALAGYSFLKCRSSTGNEQDNDMKPYGSNKNHGQTTISTHYDNNHGGYRPKAGPQIPSNKAMPPVSPRVKVTKKKTSTGTGGKKIGLIIGGCVLAVIVAVVAVVYLRRETPGPEV